MSKITINEYEKNGLGPLFVGVEEGKISSQEFVDRVEKIENRPFLRLGRFAERILALVLPIFFDHRN